MNGLIKWSSHFTKLGGKKAGFKAGGAVGKKFGKKAGFGKAFAAGHKSAFGYV